MEPCYPLRTPCLQAMLPRPCWGEVTGDVSHCTSQSSLTPWALTLCVSVSPLKCMSLETEWVIELNKASSCCYVYTKSTNETTEDLQTAGHCDLWEACWVPSGHRKRILDKSNGSSLMWVQAGQLSNWTELSSITVQTFFWDGCIGLGWSRKFTIVHSSSNCTVNKTVFGVICTCKCFDFLNNLCHQS